MIKLQNMTPKVYYEHSRDFQFIGRLYDIVLNSVKTNADLIAGLPLNEAIDNKLLDLLTMTLGFKSVHEYNIAQLKAICSAFAEIIRAKGSLVALEKACTALVNAEGITDDVLIELDGTNNIIVKIPEGVKDTSLLKDLLTYILPAGMTFTIIKAQILTSDATTTISTADSLRYTLEFADRNAVLTDDVNLDAIDISNNKIYNIPGVTLNTTVIGSNNICQVRLAVEGSGTFEFNPKGRLWYSVGEPMKVITSEPPELIYYRINNGNDEPVNYVSTGNTNEYIINITKSRSWDWAEKQWKPNDVITLTAKF